VCVCVCVVC